MSVRRVARDAIRAQPLVAVWLISGLVWLCTGAVGRAQQSWDLERALTVTRELPGCVSAPTLRARTAQYLKRATPVAHLTIEVDLQAPQFRVLRDGVLVAERRFARAPSDCLERRDALALAIAIAIEQAVAEAAEPPQPTAASSPPPTAEVPVAAQPSAAAQRAPNSESRAATAVNAPSESVREAGPAARDTESQPGTVPPPSAAETDPGTAQQPTTPDQHGALLWLVLGASLQLEALPTSAAAFSFGAELALLPALRIRLSGLFSWPVSTQFQGGTVSTQLLGAELTGCLNTPALTHLFVHGCVGAVGGIIEASGERFAINLSDRMGWLATLVRARLEFPIVGRVALGAYADARVSLLRPELQARLAGEPARTRAVAPIGASLGIELSVRLY